MVQSTRRALAGLLGAAAVAHRARAAETLTVGAYPSNPPFEFKDEHGTFDGLEVELARLVAQRLGMEMQISDLGFQALFAATASRRIDLATSSITITPDRLRNQDFTQPYMDTGLALIAGTASRLTGLSDLCGATLGSIASSTGDAWVKANMEKYGIAAAKTYDTAANLFLDVGNGRVDGGVNDEAGSRYAFRTMRGLRVVETIASNNRIGMMLPKGSPLIVRVNDVLSQLKREGTVAKLYQQWFGVPPAEGSSTVTVLPLPQAS